MKTAYKGDVKIDRRARPLNPPNNNKRFGSSFLAEQDMNKAERAHQAKIAALERQKGVR